MRRQVARIIADGVAQGAFRAVDPDATAAAVLHATLAFHHPQHVLERTADPAGLAAVLALVVAGLRAGTP
jgi:pyridoxal biosynthesis lyase PdxS